MKHKIVLFLLLVMTLLSGCGNQTNDVVVEETVQDKEKQEIEPVVQGEIEKPDVVESIQEDDSDVELQKIDYEEEIRKHFLNKKEIEEEIKLVILANLENAAYVELLDEGTDPDYRKMLTDALVDDSIDNSILAKGTKSAIDAACDGKTLDEIVLETMDGLKSGTSSKIQSTIQKTVEGDFSKIKNLQLFEIATWIHDFVNVDDTPVGLINGMIELQYRDVQLLATALFSDQVLVGDLEYLQAIYNRICDRQQEIISAGGNAKRLVQTTELEDLINQWNAENTAIYELDINRTETVDLSSNIKNNFDFLHEISVGELPSCYDIAGYRTEQKYVGQSSMLSDKLFGDFLGAMATNDLENNQLTIQKERASFYGRLEQSLEASFYDVCTNKSRFDILYNVEGVNEEALNDAAIEYLNALYRYADDYKNAIMLWDNTLSQSNEIFVNELRTNLDNMYSLINEGINRGIAATGYDSDTEIQRYVELVDTYMDYMQYSMIYSNYEPQYISVRNVIEYGSGNFNVYLCGLDAIPILFAEEQMDTNYRQERYLWVFDKQGNPIYVKNAKAVEYIKDGLPVRLLSPEGELVDNFEFSQKQYNRAAQILADYQNGIIK